MMLLQNGTGPCSGFTGRFIGRYIRAVLLLLTGAVVVASMALVISQFDTGGHGRVYAVNASSGSGKVEQQFQTGLMGIVNGVADMERYSDVTRLVGVADSDEEVLAGARGLDRRVIHQTTLKNGTEKAGELGYHAQQMVLNNQMSEDEYYTLLQIVEAEATGGDVISKMIVAGVVLNRVRDTHFPDSIYEVVWQKDQFQPTSDGRIYSCTITDSTIEAVERVLQGEDYSQGALFFFARNSSEEQNVSWFDTSLVPVFQYGGHEYFTFKDYVND